MSSLAKQLAEQMPSAGFAGQYIPPTKRKQLELQREQLELVLSKVNAAIAALDAHPELEEFINVLQAAGI